MGILGTLAIDRDAGAMYFVADTFNGQSDAFQLHAVSLGSGADLLEPVRINFSASLFRRAIRQPFSILVNRRPRTCFQSWLSVHMDNSLRVEKRLEN